MKSITIIKKEKRARRHQKIRTQIIGTMERPRLSVFRSNRFVYAQIINDTTGETIVSASDIKDTKDAKVARAGIVGTTIAKAALAKGITSVVFDRGGFKYTGRVQALADAARNAGLSF